MLLEGNGLFVSFLPKREREREIILKSYKIFSATVSSKVLVSSEFSLNTRDYGLI